MDEIKIEVYNEVLERRIENIQEYIQTLKHNEDPPTETDKIRALAKLKDTIQEFVFFGKELGVKENGSYENISEKAITYFKKKNIEIKLIKDDLKKIFEL